MWFSWQKGCGYHLDLFWVGVLMAACSFLGLPWYVAATVISIAHIDSLKMESASSAPGEQPQFLGVRLVQRKTRFRKQEYESYQQLYDSTRETPLRVLCCLNEQKI